VSCVLYISLRHRTETEGISPTVIPAKAGNQAQDGQSVATPIPVCAKMGFALLNPSQI